MTDLNQLREDVSFVRQAIHRRSGTPPGRQVSYLIWAVYVLIGFALIDHNPHLANGFFAIGFPFAAALSWWLGRKAAAKFGEIDLERSRRAQFHFYGGVIFAVVTANALAAVIPALHGPEEGQVLIVLLGMVYFLAGVHIDAHFLWLGPLLMVAALMVGRVSVYPGTCLGVVFAFGLSVPYLVSLLRRGNAR